MKKGRPRGAAFAIGSERASKMAQRAGRKRWGRCLTCGLKLPEHVEGCPQPELDRLAAERAEQERIAEEARLGAEAAERQRIAEEVMARKVARWKKDLDREIAREAERNRTTLQRVVEEREQAPAAPEPIVEPEPVEPAVERHERPVQRIGRPFPDHVTPEYDSARYGVRCPMCGVNVTTDRRESLPHVLAEHLGEIQGTTARCNQVRRNQGLI